MEVVYLAGAVLLTRRFALSVIGIFVIATSMCWADENVSFSGFGSITGGLVTEGEKGIKGRRDTSFLADYQQVSSYDHHFSLTPESLLGVQFGAEIDDKLSVTLQTVFRANNDFDPEVDWAYISYSINPDLDLQIGRKGLPLFYYSDHYAIGYAYPWIRPSGDMYTWQIHAYNGASLTYKKPIGDFSIVSHIYYGSETDENNELLKRYFTFIETREKWTNIKGGVISVLYKNFEFNLRHMSYVNERTVSGSTIKNPGLIPTSGIPTNNSSFEAINTVRDGLFKGASVHYQDEDYFILAEMGKMDMSEDKFENYLFSIGRTWNAFTPFLSFSKFRETSLAGGENHDTRSAGVRWDFSDSYALKLQYDNVNDHSTVSPVAGSSEAIAVSLDFVF